MRIYYFEQQESDQSASGDEYCSEKCARVLIFQFLEMRQSVVPSSSPLADWSLSAYTLSKASEDDPSDMKKTLYMKVRGH
jgi:hypothetical protein